MIDHDGSRLGFLVDQVESVITTTDEQQRPVSQLLEGNDGTWVREILLLNNRVILVLEAESLTRISRGESVPQQVADPAVTDDLELKLDEGLRSLLALSSSRKEDTIVPQLESVVQHTEAEVIKVLEKVELMLTSTDTIFTGLGRFKQEVAVSGMQGWEEKMSELDQVSQDLQMNIFDVIQQLQFQDIVRQKLENVLRHIAGMANVISDGLD
uniref:CheW-like domain-containing protein n=1 Tax=uncultured bacterium contig00038 TaxID=1181526 RepID=A0A806KR71_9BACT|nr:hypothetical protein [uncultured bacterium contig00038]